MNVWLFIRTSTGGFNWHLVTCAKKITLVKVISYKKLNFRTTEGKHKKNAKKNFFKENVVTENGEFIFMLLKKLNRSTSKR